MPHERIPLTLYERPEVSPVMVINPIAHPSRPPWARWAAASADFIESLWGERAGDPLVLLAEAFGVAADAELVCVVGPRVVVQGDAGAEEEFAVHTAHESLFRKLDGLAFPAAGSLCARAIASGRPFLVGGGDRAVSGPESLLILGPTLLVPVAGAGESGRPAVVFTASRVSGAPPYTAVDLDSAEEFARLARAGLHVERSITDRARLAVRTDRDRIAREMHDRVIQRVFAAGLAVQALGGIISDPVLAQRLADQVGALDAVIVEIRNAIFGLSIQEHPDRPSVRRRILDLLDELGPLFAHRPRLVFSGAIDLVVTAPLAEDLVAVVREGLTNVLRHAGTQATVVSVSVSVAVDTLTIEVSDNGVGLSGSERCSGVANLRARAERWQGMAALTDRIPSGTQLHWTARLTDAPVRTR